MKDLRVQEFLKDLVVGVAPPSDLAGSIIVKILHNSEGGDVEQVAQPRNKSLIFVISYLSFSHLCLYILHAFIIYILTCLMYLCFIDIHACVVLISCMLLY